MNPAPLARPVAEQILLTYPNRARPVVPSCYEVNHLQVWTRDHWYPAPWFTVLARLENTQKSEAA